MYNEQKWQHAFASMLEITDTPFLEFDKKVLKKLLLQALETKEWMVKEIYDSRAKDYHNAFRTMVYDTKEEMEKVIGKLEDNSFINDQVKELKQFRSQINNIIKSLRL
jgi:uncharacterized coiled-coil DUF342 family protein